MVWVGGGYLNLILKYNYVMALDVTNTTPLTTDNLCTNLFLYH